MSEPIDIILLDAASYKIRLGFVPTLVSSSRLLGLAQWVSSALTAETGKLPACYSRGL